MKSLYKIKLVLLLALMTACNSFLEKNDPAGITPEDYTNEEMYESLVNSMYAPLRDLVSNPDLFFYGTDISWANSNAEVISLNNYDGIESDYSLINDLWVSYYAGIHRANTAIERAEEVNMPAEKVAIRVGEAKFIRAFFHFYAVQMWGDVPLMTEVVNGVQTEMLRVPQTEVYNQIILDLQDAINSLPETAADYGRATSTAAKHLLSKVYLTRGYKEFAETSDFSNAAKLADEVIFESDRSLVDNFQDLWEESNEENEEVIFSVQYSTDLSTIGKGNDQRKWFGFTYESFKGMQLSSELGRKDVELRPTAFFFQLFDTDADLRYRDGFKHVYLANMDEGELSEGDVAIYFPDWDKPWSEEDKSKVNYEVVNFDEWNVHNSKDNGSAYPMLWKFHQAFTYDKGTRDAFLMRLGETFLISAEAYQQLGERSKAADRINTLRTRSTNEGYEMDFMINASDITLDFILDERARELFGEMHRWYDLVRTNKFVERVSQHNPLAKEAQKINVKNMLRPIPLKQIDLSTNPVEQNEGY